MRSMLPPLVVAALAACGDEVTRDPTITPLDGRPDDLPEAIAREVAALDPKVDADQDGLVDVEELVGWRIRVNSSGRDQGIVARFVASDPTLADTDGDGLLDGVERMVGSDPDATDTDGDGLGDRDEVERWGTSPATVDTDGDARGKDPDPSAAPDVALFDGAELKLEADPADPDGPLVPAWDATNPLQGDSDGDGLWDWDENGTPTRSSVIAETPILRVGVVPASTIGLWLDLEATDGSGQRSSRGKELAFGGSTSFRTANSLSSSVSTWIDSMIREGVTFGAGADLKHMGAQGGVHVYAEGGVGITSELTSEFSMSSTIETNFSQSLDEVATDERERSLTVKSGRVALFVEIVNDGPVPCKVDNLSVFLGYRDGRDGGVMRPVAELRALGEDDEELVVASGEHVPLLLEARELPAERVRSLMAQPANIMLMPANYDVVTAGDDDYDFIEAAVRDRTATVDIDFGSSQRRVTVAAQVFRDDGGRPIGIPVSAVLDLAGIPWDADPIVDGGVGLQEYVFKIGDTTTELFSDPAPTLGDPRPYPEGLDPGTRPIARGWYAMILRRGGAFEIDPQLVAARLLPGDRATLMLAEDHDRDGIPAPLEFARGTSDEAIDSDGDGLSDWWEIKVGWQVAVVGAPPRAVLPNPARADGDGDGLDDLRELELGTDPWREDSDADAADDATEAEDPDDGRDPLRFEDTVPPVVVCNTASRGDFAAYDFRVTDASLNLVTVRVVWADGRVTRLSFSRRREWVERLVYPGLVDHVEAFDVYGNMTTATCATPED